MIKGMDDVKLPDLSVIRYGQKRDEALPPQRSAEDTANWDDRAFTTPNISSVREFIFDTPPIDVSDVIPNPLLKQGRNKSAIREKKNSLD